MKKSYLQMLSEDLNSMSNWQKYILDLILIIIFIYAVYSIILEAKYTIIKLSILIITAVVAIYLFEKYHHKK